jgi:hypothetical protein
VKRSEIDRQIDNLFKLPLANFTARKNALAKQLSGRDRKHVKALAKPTVPMWAINQLYWRDRATYSALIDAAEKRRTAYRAALKGKKADVQKAEALHSAALQRAIAKTMGLLEQSGERVSNAARQTVRTALAALPVEEAPGRLSRPPEPAGFSLLFGRD